MSSCTLRPSTELNGMTAVHSELPTSHRRLLFLSRGWVYGLTCYRNSWEGTYNPLLDHGSISACNHARSPVLRVRTRLHAGAHSAPAALMKGPLLTTPALRPTLYLSTCLMRRRIARRVTQPLKRLLQSK